MSVRDPVERAKSSYNWRKHTCQETAAGSYGKIMCSPLDRVFYECYTTLNAFSEGSCDGSLCGDGWNETSAHIEHLESLVKANFKRRGEALWRPRVHSCEEARSSMMSIDLAVCTCWPPLNEPRMQAPSVGC